MLSFSRATRLQSRKEFKQIFSQSDKVSYRYLVALYRVNHSNQSRLGIIIAKKLMKSAVKRNLIKRVVRESFRHYQEKIPGFDIIVLMRSTQNKLSLNTIDKLILRKDIDNLWQQLPLLSVINASKSL